MQIANTIFAIAFLFCTFTTKFHVHHSFRKMYTNNVYILALFDSVFNNFVEMYFVVVVGGRFFFIVFGKIVVNNYFQVASEK